MINHPTLMQYEFDEGYNVLFVEEATNLQIEFEVIRSPKGKNRFNYYGVASKISGDLLTFLKIFRDTFE